MSERAQNVIKPADDLAFTPSGGQGRRDECRGRDGDHLDADQRD